MSCRVILRGMGDIGWERGLALDKQPYSFAISPSFRGV